MELRAGGNIANSRIWRLGTMIARFLIYMFLALIIVEITMSYDILIASAETLIYSTAYFLQTFDERDTLKLLLGQMCCILLIHFRYWVAVCILVGLLMTVYQPFKRYQLSLLVKYILLVTVHRVLRISFSTYSYVIFYMYYCPSYYIHNCNHKTEDDAFFLGIIILYHMCWCSRTLTIENIFYFVILLLLWILLKSRHSHL